MGPPKNPLLVRDSVGKAKASCYDLPDERFAYGRPGNHDREGAREVSMFWVNHKPSTPRACTAPDFVLFNKKAAGAKVTTARDLAFYRKEFENLTPRYAERAHSARGAPSQVARSDGMDGFTYGKKVRPSTPIDEVMSHRFAERAEDDLRKFYMNSLDEEQRASSMVRKIPMTTASRGHALRAREAHHHEEAREAWTMRKFENIRQKVHTGPKKAAYIALLKELMKEADRPASCDVGQEACDSGGETGPPGACETF